MLWLPRGGRAYRAHAQLSTRRVSLAILPAHQASQAIRARTVEVNLTFTRVPPIGGSRLQPRVEIATAFVEFGARWDS